MCDVVAQDLILDAPQGGANRGDLRDDVDAVTVLLDHPREPAHLTFNPFEPLETRRLDRIAHGKYIPPRGMQRKPCASGSCHVEYC